MNTVFHQKKLENLKYISLLTIILVSAVVIVRIEGAYIIGILLLCVTLVVLIKKPELSLAIQLNGILLYSYVIYKLGIETSTMLTGSVYGVLAGGYLSGASFILLRSKYKIRLTIIDGLFGLLFFLFFVSYLLFSIDNNFASQKVNYAPLLVVAPYVGIQLLHTSSAIEKVYRYRAMVSALLMIPALYELLSNPIFGESGRYSMYIFSDRSNNPILLGLTFAFLLLYLIYIVARKGKIEIKYIFLMLPAALLMLRSGARGPLISFLVAIIFFIYSLRAVGKKFKLIISGLLLALALVAFYFIPDTTITYYQSIYGPTSAVQEEADRSIQQRIVLMSLAIDEFVDNPIFGVGTGNSSGGIGFPHNALIEVAAEFGLIGLTIFLWLCAATFYKAWKVIKAEDPDNPDYLTRLTLAMFIFSFVESMFSSYMGGDTLFYSSIAIVSSLIKIREWEKRSY